MNACRDNSGTIGDNSCNGYEACIGNTENIPDNCPSISEFTLGRCVGEGPGMTLGESQNAGNARWILRAMPWGGFTNSAGDPTVNHKSNQGFEMPQVSVSDANMLFANAIPFASDHDSGRIFFYLNGYHNLPGATLTVSQGGVNPALFAISGCGTSPDSIVDIQEPQCIKLSVSGDAYHCGEEGKGDKEECISTGKQALFAAHPEMEEWDADKYIVHELYPRDDGFWMINFYGGNAGAQMGGIEGFTNVPEEYIVPHDIQGGFTYEVPPFAEEALPEDAATRARWITHNALWATVSTLDNEADGYTFGNPRSITDGQSLALSTGLPVFNCPDEDATAVDLEASGMQVALSFSEGQVFGRVSADGDTCGGMCVEVVVYGTVETLEANSTEYNQALADFKVTHPLAEWIWQGGSHMSSKYYTVRPTRILLRESPDQAAQSINVEEYLGVAFSGDDVEEIKVHKLVRNEGYVGRGE